MSITRSRQLLDDHRSALLVVDVQQRLLPTIPRAGEVVWNASRLLRAAKQLDVPVVATEQYPQGLGTTDERLRSLMPQPFEKAEFSAGQVPDVLERFESTAREQIVVCGIETHVCVLQTVLDLLADGYDVAVVTDAVAARGEPDHAMAIERLRSEGAIATTTESVLFEWCKTASRGEFKAISQLVREAPAEGGEAPG